MIIAVSACLLGEPCRYDGAAKPNAAVQALREGHTIVPVCPESMGGLPIPRLPNEIVADADGLRVADSAGTDNTGAFVAGARKVLERAQRLVECGKDVVVLLDEHGKEMRSLEFAEYMKRKMNTVNKRLVFIIGGPYGFSEKVYQAAHEKISMSKMTFSHQMIRLIFVEQIYRAMTILNGGPYHHE